MNPAALGPSNSFRATSTATWTCIWQRLAGLVGTCRFWTYASRSAGLNARGGLGLAPSSKQKSWREIRAG